MKKIEIIRIEKHENPRFIKTEKVIASREGQELVWEKIKTHNSVHIIVFDIEKEEFILVRQVRIPVLANDPSQDGVVYELCAGIVDKDLSLEQIALEEVEEEIGYRPESVQFIKAFKSSVGASGANSSLFYCEIDSSMKVSDGGGLSSEDIEVVRIPTEELDLFLHSDVHTDAMTMFGIYWFMKHIH